MVKKKILIVDDNRLSLEITRQTLEQAGYDVIGEESGEKGNDPALRHIPTIVLTARDSQQEIEEVKRMGALDCFAKHRMPPAKLRECVKLILGQ